MMMMMIMTMMMMIFYVVGLPSHPSRVLRVMMLRYPWLLQRVGCSRVRVAKRQPARPGQEQGGR
jgi:hypothetical protein